MTTSPYLTATEAAAYLRKSPNAFYALLCRRRKAGFPITTYRLNGRLRFKVADLDAAMTCERSRFSQQRTA